MQNIIELRSIILLCNIRNNSIIQNRLYQRRFLILVILEEAAKVKEINNKRLSLTGAAATLG